jgi:hypothetical protein
MSAQGSLFEVDPRDGLKPWQGGRPVDEDRTGKVRRDHPSTSRAAARSLRSGSARARVFEAICAAPNGLTDEEIQARLGMNPSTQRPRRVELVEDERIRDSGQRRPTASGSLAIVWVAA